MRKVLSDTGKSAILGSGTSIVLGLAVVWATMPQRDLAGALRWEALLAIVIAGMVAGSYCFIAPHVPCLPYPDDAASTYASRTLCCNPAAPGPRRNSKKLIALQDSNGIVDCCIELVKANS
jgi:hypothetical protein